MDKKFNFYRHSNSKKVWFLNGEVFMSDKGSNNGKNKAVAYARSHMMDEKEIIKFDSELEYKRYCFLLNRLKKGEIKDLKEHFTFQLLEPFTNANGVNHEELLYEADFFYYDKKQKKYIVEDVKGVLEDVFRVKWKLFDKIYFEKNLSIACVRMRKGRKLDILDESSWYYFSENKKSTKKIDKLREENKVLKEREKVERKKARELERISKLQSKKKRTKAENERLLLLMQKYMMV